MFYTLFHSVSALGRLEGKAIAREELLSASLTVIATCCFVLF